MITRVIHSLQHPIVKYLHKLRTDKAFRAEEKKAILSGKKVLLELNQHFTFSKIVCENEKDCCLFKAEEYLIASPSIMKKITGVESPEGFAAVIQIPEHKDFSKKERLLFLDGIADPGNLGTLLRSALAFEWDGVLILKESCDPYNDKALRAAQGATFRLPISQLSKEQFLHFIREEKLSVYVADARGKPFSQADIKPPFILVLGSESHGVSSWIKDLSTLISIPISRQVESLNVAIAGGILLYSLKGTL